MISALKLKEIPKAIYKFIYIDTEVFTPTISGMSWTLEDELSMYIK